MNMKLDAIMKKQGITRQDLLRVEDEIDKQLEYAKRKIERKN